MLLRRSLYVAALLVGCSSDPPPAPVAPSSAPAPAPPSAPAPKPLLEHAVVHVGGGCDGAKADYVRRCMAAPDGCREGGGKEKENDVSAYAAVLNQGAYLNECNTPPTSAVKVCAAIMGGHAIAVSITVSPGDEEGATCIAKKIQALSFPSSPRLDVTNTTFAGQ
jgi:hypothetical protein